MVFENDSFMKNIEISTEFVDKSIKKQIEISEDENLEQWYFDNLGIEDKEDLGVYTSEFHTNGGFDCASIYELIDESFDFFVDLYMSYSDTAGLLDKIKGFQTSGIINEEMDVEFVQYVTGAVNDKENFNQNFLMYFNNVDNKSYIRGLIEPVKYDEKEPTEYEKFAEAWLEKDTEGQLEGKIKVKKLKQYIEKTLITAPLLMDRPFVQATVQIPLSVVPALLKKLYKKITHDNIFDWLNNCKDLYSANKSLCLILKSQTCEEDEITHKVLGLSLIFAQFFISPLFNPKLIDEGGNGLKTYFPYLPRTSIKEMYNNFEIKEKKVFQCIFKNEENYKKENILRSYLTYKNEKPLRKEIKLKNYIASIFTNPEKRDKLSPAPGLENNGSLGSLRVPWDCMECVILEIRTFYLIPSHVGSYAYYKDRRFGDQAVSYTPRTEILMKDVSVWFKMFSKEFFELKAEEFFMDSDEVDEDQVDSDEMII